MGNINDIFKAFKPPLTNERKKLITEAFTYAQLAHQGQKRKSGEDYFEHPFNTALNLANLGMGSRMIAAGLLHDVPEDTEFDLKQVEKKFGKEIASLVDGVTKLGKLKLREKKEELYLENLRKMFIAMASDIRIIIIRLADRLHNMETLEALPKEKQQRIALETMEIYSPIANRLGIGEIKTRLEDLAFKYLDQKNFEYTKKLLEKEAETRKKQIDEAIARIKEEVEKENIKVSSIAGRHKGIYSLFKKMERHDMDINKVYDVAGIRVIVPDIASCYKTLGVVHKTYHPLVGRIKDYISLPKPNGYQSIHTTIFGPEGKFLEVQIRTPKMDDEAEFGIAAHWIYSEQKKNWRDYFRFGKQPESQKPKEELAWVRQLREWQNEIGKNDEEFLKGLKIDFFKNHIFAFTPKGTIIELPEEATPIDFAYMVHSEIGHRATGAKANGKMVPLDYKIQNGDVIEILVSKDKKNPNQNWLHFVRTSAAKSKIRHYLKNHEHK